MRQLPSSGIGATVETLIATQGVVSSGGLGAGGFSLGLGALPSSCASFFSSGLFAVRSLAVKSEGVGNGNASFNGGFF